MSAATALLSMVTAAVPGAVLWRGSEGRPPADLVVVFDGIIPPEPPTRYLMVFVDNGHAEAGQVGPRSDSLTTTMQVSSISPDRERSGWLATRVRDALVDQRPTATGWSFGVIEHTVSRPPTRDEVVADRPAVYAVDLYRVVATRA